MGDGSVGWGVDKAQFFGFGSSCAAHGISASERGVRRLRRNDVATDVEESIGTCDTSENVEDGTVSRQRDRPRARLGHGGDCAVGSCVEHGHGDPTKGIVNLNQGQAIKLEIPEAPGLLAFAMMRRVLKLSDGEVGRSSDLTRAETPRNSGVTTNYKAQLGLLLYAFLFSGFPYIDAVFALILMYIQVKLYVLDIDNLSLESSPLLWNLLRDFRCSTMQYVHAKLQ